MVGALEQIFRDEWGRVLANLIGFLGDFDLAEEGAQEAFAIAAERWPRDGAPANPRAWLVATGRNRAIDRIRRERTLAAKTPLLDLPRSVEDDVDETTIPDERLELWGRSWMFAVRDGHWRVRCLFSPLPALDHQGTSVCSLTSSR